MERIKKNILNYKSEILNGKNKKPESLMIPVLREDGRNRTSDPLLKRQLLYP